MTVLEAVKLSKTPTLMQKRAIHAAQEMLRSDESVLWAMTANICEKSVADLKALTLKDMTNVVLVVTDQRIFYVTKLPATGSSTIIPLWEIRSITEELHLSSRYLRIQGITKQLLVDGHIKTIPSLHSAIQNALAKYAAPAAASEPASAITGELDVEQLKTLKELYDAGILTEEEFSAKKAQILSI